MGRRKTAKEKAYELECFWRVWGKMEVKATSPRQAIEKAYQTTKLPDGSYVDDSFEVDKDSVK